jgi:hypothetical protein
LSLVSSKNKKVFLSTTTKINTIEKVDVIISPELYWVRIFDIPVKNITHARHVLPTLFEDILENVTELSYQVIKLEENKYLCFAYVNKTIYEAIKKSGISLSLVDSVYFAQNECSTLNQFTDENKSFLYTEDGVLIKVPNSIALESVDLNQSIDTFELSSHKVDIKLYNNVLSTKQIYTILAVILTISIINFYKLFDYKSQVNSFEEEILITKQNSTLPSSILQTNAILNKYKKKISKEFKKREFLEYIISSNKYKLKKIYLDKNTAFLTFNNEDKKKLENFIAKKYKVISSKVKALDIEVKVKL